MGLLNSKSFDDVSEALPQTPSYRAKPRKVLALDPRSPSDDIVRTPIQVEQTPKSESPDTMLFSEDPRSPTAGLPRTPVAVPEKVGRKNGVVGQDLKNKMSISDNQDVEIRPKQLFCGTNDVEKSVLHASNSGSDLNKVEVTRKHTATVFDFSVIDKENDPLLDHQQ